MNRFLQWFLGPVLRAVETFCQSTTAKMEALEYRLMMVREKEWESERSSYQLLVMLQQELASLTTTMSRLMAHQETIEAQLPSFGERHASLLTAMEHINNQMLLMASGVSGILELTQEHGRRLETTLTSELRATGLALSTAIQRFDQRLIDNETYAPRLSLATLRAWDAVRYAAKKYEAEKEKPADREKELRIWAQLYLHEHHVSVSDDMLNMLIVLYDYLKSMESVRQ